MSLSANEQSPPSLEAGIVSPTSAVPGVFWKEFWCLLALAIISVTVGLVPVVTSVSAMPAGRILETQVIFTFVASIVFAAIIYLGLRLSSQIRLPRAPILEALLGRRRVLPLVLRILAPALTLGLIYLLLAVFLANQLPHLLGPAPRGVKAPELLTFGPPGQQRQLHLAGPVGFAVALGFPLFEEIFFRLFLFTLIAWLFSRIFRSPEGKPSSTVFWMANITQALAFGLFHLPNGSTVWWEPWFMQVLAAPQCWLGLIAGYLFWHYGLEASVLAHLTADLLLVIGIAFS